MMAMIGRTLMSLLAAVGLGVAAPADGGIPVLPPKAFAEQAKADSAAVILDVRTPEEYAEGHLKGSVSLDWLNTEAFNMGVARLDKAHTYFIYCRSGRRSHAAARWMRSLGFNVRDMEGGILAWTAQNLPISKE